MGSRKLTNFELWEISLMADGTAEVGGIIHEVSPVKEPPTPDNEVTYSERPPPNKTVDELIAEAVEKYNRRAARAKMIEGLQALVDLEIKTQLATGEEEILEPSPDKMRTFTLALIVELSEVLQELNWKPWKLDKQVSFTRVIQEEADVFAFFLLHLAYLCRICDATVEDFVDAFIEKSRVNVARLSGEVQGYGYTKGNLT